MSDYNKFTYKISRGKLMEKSQFNSIYKDEPQKINRSALYPCLAWADKTNWERLIWPPVCRSDHSCSATLRQQNGCEPILPDFLTWMLWPYPQIIRLLVKKIDHAGKSIQNRANIILLTAGSLQGSASPSSGEALIRRSFWKIRK